MPQALPHIGYTGYGAYLPPRVVSNDDLAVVLTGKFAGHFITARECDECHDTVAWLPHTFQHIGLSYEPLNHRANLLCSACHLNNTETVNWPHPAFIPDCAGCHANDFRSEGDHIGGNSGTVSQNRNCAGSGCHRISDSSFN